MPTLTTVQIIALPAQLGSALKNQIAGFIFRELDAIYEIDGGVLSTLSAASLTVVAMHNNDIVGTTVVKNPPRDHLQGRVFARTPPPEEYANAFPRELGYMFVKEGYRRFGLEHLLLKAALRNTQSGSYAIPYQTGGESSYWIKLIRDAGYSFFTNTVDGRHIFTKLSTGAAGLKLSSALGLSLIPDEAIFGTTAAAAATAPSTGRIRTPTGYNSEHPGLSQVREYFTDTYGAPAWATINPSEPPPSATINRSPSIGSPGEHSPFTRSGREWGAQVIRPSDHVAAGEIRIDPNTLRFPSVEDFREELRRVRDASTQPPQGE